MTSGTMAVRATSAGFASAALRPRMAYGTGASTLASGKRRARAENGCMTMALQPVSGASGPDPCRSPGSVLSGEMTSWVGRSARTARLTPCLAAVVHRARRPGLADSRGNGPAVRRADARRLRLPGRLRGTCPGRSTASTGFTPSASSGTSTRWKTSPPGYDRVSHCGRVSERESTVVAPSRDVLLRDLGVQLLSAACFTRAHSSSTS